MRRWFRLITIAMWFTATVALGQISDEVDRRKVVLESELKLVEQQIAEQTKLLRVTERQSASLERDREILNQQIKRAKLIIKQQQLEIERLGGDIKQKSGTITELTDKIQTTKVALAELLRKRRLPKRLRWWNCFSRMIL